MSKQVDFINREDELSLIESLINKWGTSLFLCIDGEGGIGKTRLLQEIPKKIVLKSDSFVLTDIIDFDDKNYHLPDRIGQKIAKMLDESAFIQYLSELTDYYKMEKAGVSIKTLSEKIETINKVFIDCFNKISITKRIVLFFDTTEVILKTDFWNYLTMMGSQLKNCLLLISGRNSRKNGEYLRDKFGMNAVYFLDLLPLSPEAGEEYIIKKRAFIKDERLKSQLAELDEKLIFLSGGRPILIDLAVEWIARNIPLDWLTDKSIAELKSISHNEREKYQKDFERCLVVHIAEYIYKPINKLILLMSHFYPIDCDIITSLLYENKQSDAETLFNEAKSYAFIKVLPDGHIKLHDEMHRMIKEYVLDISDPEKDKRKQYSSFAIKYLENQIHQLEIEFNSNKSSVEQIYIRQSIHILKSEYLRHSLFIDIENGVQIFIELFDSVTQKPNISLTLREILIAEMDNQIHNITPQQYYMFIIRKIRHLRETGSYLQAKDNAVNILKQTLLPEQYVDIHIEIGNIQIRLGCYKSGIDNFIKAVKLCEDNEFENKKEFKSYLMRTKNALGWGYRLIGRYEDAIIEYTKAREISSELDEKLQEAIILNNLAFAYARSGNYFGATNFADEANELWERLENEEGKGAIHHVYSEIYGLQSDFDNAIKECKRALDIFIRLNHKDWINRLHSILVVYYWERADFLFVKKGYSEDHRKIIDDDLKSSEKEFELIDSESQYKMTALHYLGHIYLTKYEISNDKNYLGKAEKCFKDSYEDSKRLSLNIIQLNSLGDLLCIAEKNKEIDKLDYFKRAYEDYKKEWGIYPEYFSGLFLKSLGDMYLSISPPDLDNALKSYIESIHLICLTMVRRVHYLKIRLKDIQKRLEAFKDIKIKLGNALIQLWTQESKLVFLHPEARRFFAKWQKGENLHD